MSRADTSLNDISSDLKHIHLGAGSFGLGMVVELCQAEAGFRTAVASRESNKDYHHLLKRNGSYTVVFDGDRSKTIKPELHYYTEENDSHIVDLIADPSVSLVTTAVRKENLPAIASLLGRAMMKRGRGDEHGDKLCVIACENLPGNSLVLRDHVRSFLAKEEYGDHLFKEVVFCNTLVDRVCAPISCSSGSVEIPVESFHSWIVQAPDVRVRALDVLQQKELVNIAKDGNEFSAHETQKYWCMNGLHLAAAAYSFNYKKDLRHFSQSLAVPSIATKVRMLQVELGLAFLLHVSDSGLQDQFSEKMVERYNLRTFRRLQRNRTDTIGRVLKLDYGSPGGIIELLDRIERLVAPLCKILAHRKGLISPSFESVALHGGGSDVRLELDDAVQQVVLAMRTFSYQYHGR